MLHKRNAKAATFEKGCEERTTKQLYATILSKSFQG